MRKILLFIVAAIALASPGAVQAGVYADDLTKCVVRSTTETDQVAFMRWMFAAFSTNPALEDMVQVKPQQVDQLTRKVASLFQRLIVTDCRSEYIAALKYEGNAAIGAAFNTLGNVAARNLMTNPNTLAMMGKLEQYADKAELEQLAREAGVPTKSPAPLK